MEQKVNEISNSLKEIECAMAGLSDMMNKNEQNNTKICVKLDRIIQLLEVIARKR